MKYQDQRPSELRPLDQQVMPSTKVVSPRAIIQPPGLNAFSGARATGTGQQSLTTAVDTIITWDTEDYDVGGYHSTVSNTSRLTIPSAGYYFVFGKIYYAANVTGSRWCTILKNGSAIRGEQSQMAVTTAGYQTLVSTAMEDHFAAGDYIELRGHQTSGGNLNVERSSSCFGISLIALG